MTQQIDTDHDEAMSPDEDACPACGEPYDFRVLLPLPEEMVLVDGTSLCKTGQAIGYAHKDSTTHD